MRTLTLTLALALALALAPALAGCPDDDDDTAIADTTAQDTGADAAADTVTSDAVTADTGVADTGAADTTPPLDTAVADTVPDIADTVADAPSDTTPGVTQTAWGPIEGVACGGLSAALSSPDPSFHATTWTFDSATFDALPLDPGPAKRYREPNAGGSSKCSEVMSMQWLVECEGGTLYKTETEIVYATAGSITDYAFNVGGDVIGVSVTRAYLGPFNTDYDLATAKSLLSDKLAGVNESTLNVSAGDAWTKQILHVWTLQPTWVPLLEQAWSELAAPLQSDTVVLVTVEVGGDTIVTDSCED